MNGQGYKYKYKNIKKNTNEYIIDRMNEWMNV